jgi:molybdate transport system regulatory protein
MDARVRILHGEERAFGPGRFALLRAIAASGSISAAARSLDMSYRRAWLLVQSMNVQFGAPLVTRRVGGATGGGARVTETGLAAMRLYEATLAEVERVMAERRVEWQALLSASAPPGASPAAAGGRR